MLTEDREYLDGLRDGLCARWGFTWRDVERAEWLRRIQAQTARIAASFERAASTFDSFREVFEPGSDAIAASRPPRRPEPGPERTPDWIGARTVQRAWDASPLLASLRAAREWVPDDRADHDAGHPSGFDCFGEAMASSEACGRRYPREAIGPEETDMTTHAHCAHDQYEVEGGGL